MDHSQEFLALVNDAKSRIREIDIAAYLQLRTDGMPHVLVDVREESEWAKGHLPGAIHIGRGIIERDIVAKVPQKDAKLILYCGGGYRSALTADNLQKMGYRDAVSLAGGWRAWTAAGHPVES